MNSVNSQDIDTEKEARTANTGLAKVAVQCSADTFVVNQTLVLRINICGENPPPSPSRNPINSLNEQQNMIPFIRLKLRIIAGTNI
jgi:hypothetical protein